MEISNFIPRMLLKNSLFWLMTDDKAHCYFFFFFYADKLAHTHKINKITFKLISII